MNENIQKFLEKFTTDEELQAKFSALKSPEEAYELAKSVQDGFTLEEFLEAAKSINELDEGDISDEDLAAAAGGDAINGQRVEQMKESAQAMSIDVPSSAVESAIAGKNLSVGEKVSGVISGVVSKIDDAAGGNPVSKYIKNSVKSASKAIKNALP